MHAEEIPYSSSLPPHQQEENRGCQLTCEKSYLTMLMEMGIICWQPRKDTQPKTPDLHADALSEKKLLSVVGVGVVGLGFVGENTQKTPAHLNI